jgi:ankyrin repeat protein
MCNNMKTPQACIAIVSLLLAAWTTNSANCAEERDEFGLTELHRAAQKPDTTVLKQLLREGGDPNVRSDSGWTPLFSAVVVANTNAVIILLNAGSDVNVECGNGNRPLHHASDIVSPILLARGAKIDVRNRQGWSPLHSASFFGRVETVRLLLSADASPRAKTMDGKSPLQLAREKRHTQVISILENTAK